MKVGIAGAGAIAFGYAALLTNNSHQVSLWSPSGRWQGEARKITGAIEGDFRFAACADAKELAANEVIVLALPANGHRPVFDALLPHLAAHHTIIISGHLSFAALYLAKKLAERGLQLPIAVWNTTVLTSKAQSESEIKIGALRGKVDMATLPASDAPRTHEVCTALFGDRFVLRDDLLTITLSNLNPQSHLGIALCNLTRIERGETWGQRTHITPAVGRLLEALDTERLAVATALGKSVRTVFEHQQMSFGVSGGSVAEMAQILAAQGKDPNGPKDINTRYVLEDTPFGLVPTVYLARIAGVAVPLHESGILILNACYGRDFASDNDLLPELSITDTAVLKRLAADGYPIGSASA
ncbi:NAD/NADP octopine/nopaline dehydrogenase family protein [Lacibacterium aquatile]|uniref:NAD/NADP octopine/nopaline dehydrogenase family protein n=1 Tax=Lacibacterium aquatile TaxID=1168082 RepID=A0ABW5DPE5_9PROT